MRPCSPSIDSGSSDFGRLAIDFTDIDDDFDGAESMPWDLEKFARVIDYRPNDLYVDMGAFEACPGDVNGDGMVEISDMTALLACFGMACAGDCCLADINCDGTVEIGDLTILLSHFGAPCGSFFGLVGGGGEESMNAANSLDPLSEWLRSATPEEVLDWWYAGMPPVGGDER